MRWNPSTKSYGPRLARAAVLIAAGLSILAGAASADLRYTRSFGLVPNPPVISEPTTFILYGIYPTGCGVIEHATRESPCTTESSTAGSGKFQPDCRARKESSPARRACWSWTSSVSLDHLSLTTRRTIARRSASSLTKNIPGAVGAPCASLPSHVIE